MRRSRLLFVSCTSRQKCFVANARPGSDLRYRSNTVAFTVSAKPMETMICQGKYCSCGSTCHCHALKDGASDRGRCRHIISSHQLHFERCRQRSCEASRPSQFAYAIRLAQSSPAVAIATGEWRMANGEWRMANAKGGWSGRSGLNRRHSAWEADALPLSYARV